MLNLESRPNFYGIRIDPVNPHTLDQAQKEENDNRKGTSVTDQWQRNPGDRHDEKIHPHILIDVGKKQSDHSHDKETPHHVSTIKRDIDTLHQEQHEPAEHEKIVGLDHFDKVIHVDQSPIGRTPRSNPATYTGLLTPIRELFAGVPEARARGYGPGRFSFNVKGGRCEACQGDGVIKVEMHFLPDIYVPCDVCHSKRYNRETLEIQYKGCLLYTSPSPRD